MSEEINSYEEEEEYIKILQIQGSRIKDLEAKLSTQWDSGYNYGVKEASGKIKSLEAQLARAVEALRLYADYDNECCGDYKPPNEARKTLEEIEKGE